MSITDEFDNWNPLEEDYRKLNSHRGTHQVLSSDHKPFLYIAHIPRDFDEQSLRHFFSDYGNVKSVRINQSGQNFFYGFINYHSVEEAERAYAKLKQVDTLGMIIRVGSSQSEKNQHAKRPVFHGPGQHPHADFKEKVPLKVTTNLEGEFSERLVAEVPVNYEPNGKDYEESDTYFNNNDDEALYSRGYSQTPHISEMNGNADVLFKCSNNQNTPAYDELGCASPSCVSEQMSIVPWKQGDMSIHSCIMPTPYTDCMRAVHSCCHHNTNPIYSYGRNTYCNHSTRVYDPNIPPLKANFPLCSNCRQQPGTFECTKCAEPYCSRDCQEMHWPFHKSVCRLRRMAHGLPLTPKNPINRGDLINDHHRHYEKSSVYSHAERMSNKFEDQSVTKGSPLENVSKVAHKINHNEPVELGDENRQIRGPFKKGLLKTPENIPKNMSKMSHSEASSFSDDSNQNFVSRKKGQSDVPANTKSTFSRDHQFEKSNNREIKNFTSETKSKSVDSYSQTDTKLPSLESRNFSHEKAKASDDNQLEKGNKFCNQAFQTNTSHNQKTSRNYNTSESASTKPFHSSQKAEIKKSPNKYENHDTQKNFYRKQPFDRKKRLDYDPKSATNNTNSEQKSSTIDSEVWDDTSSSVTINTAKNISEPTSNEPPSNLLTLGKIKMSTIPTAEFSTASAEKVIVSYVSSPAEFWVNLVKNEAITNQIIISMAELSKSKTTFTSPSVNDLCGALFTEDNNYYRAKISQVYDDNTVDVYFIDYGNTAKAKQSDLCFLSSNLGIYPALAIKCKLSNIKPKNGAAEWPKEATDVFVKLVSEKVLDINVSGKEDSLYSVDLINQGISVTKMLIKENFADSLTETTSSVQNMTDHESIKSSTAESLELGISTLRERLKVGGKYQAAVMFTEENSIWVWIQIDDILQEFLTMSNNISLANTKDVTMFIEEGDFAVAFSPTDKAWYRSVVMKRQKNSFCVQYIDYGNKEDVMQLKEMLPEHLKVCSPALRLQAANDNDIQKFKELIAIEKFSVVVKTLTESGFEMEVTACGKTINVVAFTLLNDLKLLTTTSSDSCENLPELVNSCPPSNANTVPIKLSKINEVLMERELRTNMKTPVVVSWIRSINEIYVQRIDDMNELNKLRDNINKFCETKTAPANPPIEGELVCARFSGDGSWYRSLTMQVLPDNKFVVLFIDYGNEEVISLDSIRRLDDMFLQPLYTISVSLYDASLFVKDKELQEKLLNRAFDLQVVDSKSSPKQVILYDNGIRVFGNSKEPQRNVLSHEVIKTIPKPSLKIVAKKKFSLKIPTDSFHGAMVIINDIDSSKNFYVRLASKENTLQSMQQEIDEFWTKNSFGEYYIEVDDVVCVRWKNMVVRGYITEVRGESCVVKLIDHKSTVEVVVVDILPLPSKYFLPVFMISVKLDSVPDTKLTDGVCEKLKEATYKLELLDQKNEPFRCKLYIDGNSVNDEFIDKPSKIAKEEEFVHIDGLEKCSLPLKEKLDVIFNHEENQFYFLHLMKDADLVTKLSEALNNSSNLSPLVKLPCIGQVVCAKFSVDQRWYRVCVEKIENVRKTCFVRFIDFGNGEEVSLQDLRDIPNEFLSFPIPCIRVKITNSQLASLYEVKTVVTSGTVEDPIVTIISSDNLASNSKNIESLVKTETETISCSVVDGNKNVASENNSSPEFMLGDVTHVDFPEGEVQIIAYFAEEGHLFCAPNIDANVTANLELVKEITHFVNSSSQKCHKTPVIGELVLAKFEGEWYRGVVVDISQTVATVLFLDFGNTQDTQFEDLRKMDKKFMTLPIQALMCKLEGFVCRDLQKLTDVISAEGFLYSGLQAIHSFRNDQHIIEIPSLTKKLKELELI